jgi:hypothetical protein
MGYFGDAGRHACGGGRVQSAECSSPAATSVAETASQTEVTGSSSSAASPTGPVTPTVGQTISVPEGPAAALPAMPPEALEMTNEGAVAFVRYWFALANYAVATGDTGPLSLMSAPECDTCADLVQQIADSYASGRLVDNTWTVVNAAVTKRDDNAFGVELTFDQAMGIEVNAAGVVTEIFPPERNTLLAVPAFQGGRWIMRGIGVP